MSCNGQARRHALTSPCRSAANRPSRCLISHKRLYGSIKLTLTDAGKLALLEPRNPRRITSIELSVQKARLESDGYAKEAEVIFRADGTKEVRIKDRRLHNNLPLAFRLERKP